MRYKIYISICSLLISGLGLNAQMTNSGDFTVLQGTEVSILNDFNNTNTGSVVSNGSLYFHQNYTNTGQFSFLSSINQGSIHFKGITQQLIQSSSMSVFYDVVFDNPTQTNAFDLSGSIFIENEADFRMGVIQSQAITNNFIFGIDGNHINTSNASFVAGAVQKQGDRSFDFPVGGNGFYRRLEISSPDIQTDLYSAKYFAENSNTNYPHNLSRGVIEFIDTKEYWRLEREQGNSEVLLTLRWNEDTTSSEILLGSTTAIHIVRWDENLGFWVDEGGIVDEDAKTVTTITNVTGYGVFALARVKEDAILPGGIVVYNLITPDGDGKNDFLRIEGLEVGTENTLQIFNRYGIKVFETSDYNNTSNVFRGFSDGRATINRGDQLPTGTYFYILNYTYNSQRIKKAGYLYINGKN